MFHGLFQLGDDYAKQSSWKDFALTKFCLFSMGLIAGMHMPDKYKKPVTCTAVTVFAATYVPLMAKVFRIALQKRK